MQTQLLSWLNYLNLINLQDIFWNFSEFWYVEQGSLSSNSRTGSFRKIPHPQRKDDKWWLPVPCVASEGLSENARKHLRQKRDSANQIHKAAMAINSSILAEMEIPQTYITSLPKVIYFILKKNNNILFQCYLFINWLLVFFFFF